MTCVQDCALTTYVLYMAFVSVKYDYIMMILFLFLAMLLLTVEAIVYDLEEPFMWLCLGMSNCRRTLN